MNNSARAQITIKFGKDYAPQKCGEDNKAKTTAELSQVSQVKSLDLNIS